jgi:signal recognition particle subunit SRP54
MFQTLTQNFTKIFDKIKGTGILTEAHIDSAMRDIRIALLEADVALPVVRDFVNIVKERAQGRDIIKSVSPGQMVIKIINDELIKLLSPSPEESKLNLNFAPPVNIMLVGLQGSGKTTASAKLALRLKNQNKKVLLVSLDTYRPAAQEQLEILANSIDVKSLSIIKDQMPLEITNRATKEAKLSGYDIVIYDTAGRLHIDEEMIHELSEVKKIINPAEILLVIDSMIGQDAVTVAGSFDEKLNVTGVVLSRIDGDARGGAALSVRHTTGKPIKFLGTGEKPQDFESFDPSRIASRILGMGDVVSLVEKAALLIDQDEAAKTAARIKKGKFDLNDYISQIKMIKKMGGFASMLKMIPGVGKFADKIDNAGVNDKVLISQEAIVSSMTKKERRNPELLNASRRKRIAAGSGTSVQQVNILLKQFQQISTLMKRAAKMDPKSLMRGGGISKFFS